MTKGKGAARSAPKRSPVAIRATVAEWAEVDKAAADAGKSRAVFVREAMLGLARGELVKAGRGVAEAKRVDARGEDEAYRERLRERTAGTGFRAPGASAAKAGVRPVPKGGKA